MGLYTCTGADAGAIPSSVNHVVWWDGDLLRELLNGNEINKYGGSRLLRADGCSSINGTKSNPCLQIDLWGDWREEVICHRIYTLLHDPVYRTAIAWQNVAYNQPPHTGFYLGDGMAPPPVPEMYYADSQMRARPDRPIGRRSVPERCLLRTVRIGTVRLAAGPGSAGRNARAYSLTGRFVGGAAADKGKAVLTGNAPVSPGVYIISTE
jgi:hypothetical protein